MANGIGRILTMGIAKQDTFNTPEATPTYTLAVQGANARINPIVQKEANTAATGSSYMNNAYKTTIVGGEFPFEVKVDEDVLPLLLLQRYTDTPAAAAGETVVYEHVLTYTNSTNNYYTLFLQDDNRNDYIMSDVLLQDLNFIFDQGFVRVTGTAVGDFPVTGAVTNSFTGAINEFVGKNVVFNYGDEDGAKSAFSVLTVNANHTFGTLDDSLAYELGSEDRTQFFLTADDYSTEVTALMSNNDILADYKDNTLKKYDITITDTNREVTGSVANTNPSIVLEYPSANVGEHTPYEGDPNEAVTQSFTLNPVDQPGITDAPAKFTITNAVASY
jgi:hypothetical protein